MAGLTREAARRLISEKAQGEYFFHDLGAHARGPLRIALGGRERCPKDYLVERRTYPYPTLEYVAAGRGELRLGDGPVVPLGPGSVFAYGPGLPLRMRTTEAEMTKYFLCLAGRGARAALLRPVDLWGRCADFGGHAEPGEVVDAIFRKGRAHTPGSARLCLNLFERLRLELAEARWWRERRRDASREAFLRCKAVVDAAPERFTSLAALVEATGLGRPALHRLFRRHHGCTPYRYLQLTRINRAAHDLIGGDRLVKEVAARWGFADPLHFSRVFRKVHGVPPVRLRASLRT